MPGRNLCSFIQPQGLGCIKRELDHSDKHVLPLPFSKVFGTPLQRLTWTSCDVGRMFPLKRDEDPYRWRDEGRGAGDAENLGEV